MANHACAISLAFVGFLFCGAGRKRGRPPKENTRPRIEPTVNPDGLTLKVNKDYHEDDCAQCGEGGTLVCCDFCSRVYHFECLGLSRGHKGGFSCPICAAKQKEIAGGAR